MDGLAVRAGPGTTTIRVGAAAEPPHGAVLVVSGPGWLGGRGCPGRAGAGGPRPVGGSTARAVAATTGGPACGRAGGNGGCGCSSATATWAAAGAAAAAPAAVVVTVTVPSNAADSPCTGPGRCRRGT